MKELVSRPPSSVSASKKSRQKSTGRPVAMEGKSQVKFPDGRVMSLKEYLTAPIGAFSSCDNPDLLPRIPMYKWRLFGKPPHEGRTLGKFFK